MTQRINTRSDFNRNLESILQETKPTEAIFVGGISSTLLTPDMNRTFANALSVDDRLHVTFVLESEDNLFRRSQYTERLSTNPRPFPKLLKRRVDILEFRQSIAAAAPVDRRDGVLYRINVLESHLQLYNVITKLDRALWVSPITHRRNSDNPIHIYSDINDPMYHLYDEYLRFLLEGPGRAFLTPPQAEILRVVDKKGVHRGYASRVTVTETSDITPTVWCLLINERQELLLQRRSRHATDNQELWDKSVGGHFDPLGYRGAPPDVEPIDTLRREMKEELGIPEILDHGELRTGIHEPGLRVGRWPAYRLFTDPHYRSRRTHPDGVLYLSFRVTAFVVLCNSAVTLRLGPDVSEVAWTPIAQLAPERDDLTHDLAEFLASAHFSRLKEFAKTCQGFEFH